MTPDPESPFRILVLADFSGRASRGLHAPEELARRKIHRVDRDDFDDVFARLDVRVALPAEYDTTLAFGDLDEIHPDRLYERVALFDELRALRRRLDDPAEFHAAARELSGDQDGERSAREAPSAPESESTSSDDLLGATLAATEGRAPVDPRSTGSPLVDALLRDLVLPHVTPARDPRQAEFVAAADAAASDLMRRLLHGPHLRGVEAAWRGLELLVRRLETNRRLQLHVLDVTRDELAADLAASPSRLRTVLVDGAHESWSLWLGQFPFGAEAEDVAVLERLGQMAEAAGAAFVADGRPALVGCPSFGLRPDPDDWTADLDADAVASWNALQERSGSRHVGLLAPRMLLRLPYGERGGTVERFAFEEVVDSLDHEGHLWGSAAVAAGLLLGGEFTRRGWALRPDVIVEIDRLPSDVREDDGEWIQTPCAEAILDSRGAERMVGRGLSPVRSVRDRPAIQIGPLRGLDGTALAGPWDR